MGNRSLRGLISKFILLEMLFTGMIALGVFFLLNISINIGFLYSANYPESLIPSFAERISEEEVTPNDIPNYYAYQLEDADGETIKQTISEKDNTQIQEAKKNGRIQSNGIIGSKIYVALEGENQNLVLAYNIASDFSSSTMRKWLPNAEILYFIAFLVFWICGFILIVQCLVKQLQKEFDKVILTNKEIGQFNLDYQPETSNIKEVNQILSSINTMKIELAHSLEEQWSNQQQQERLVQSVTHDIRTPIAIVQGNLELLEETELSPEQEEMLESAEKGIHRLSDYVMQLKQISNLTPEAEQKQIINHSVISKWVLLAKEMAKPKKIEVRVEQQDESLIDISKSQITQALQNILQNALDVSKENTHLHLAFTKTETEYTISVMDEGPGFTEEALEKGTERFFSTKDQSGSGHYGLGLAITNELVQKNNGSIQITNLVEQEKIVGAKVTLVMASRNIH